MSRPSRNRLNELLNSLASEIGNEAEDAQFCIEKEFGVDAIEPVLDLIPRLSDFPRRCALELISNCIAGEPTGLPAIQIERALIPCLNLEDEVSRAWTAEILEAVGSEISVTPLLEAIRKLRSDGIPPDWHEPMAMRSALRKLGAIHRTCPKVVSDSMICDSHFNESWSLVGINKVLEALIQERQAIISFQVWHYSKGSFYWAQANRKGVELDFGQSWSHVVRTSFENASKILDRVKITDNNRATFDWISEADL